jgi:hypothetical protein
MSTLDVPAGQHGWPTASAWVGRRRSLLTAADHVSLVGLIASLDRLVQQYSVDEIVVALPPNRREQLGRIVARGLRAARSREVLC